jgi:hypothetical protein
MGESKGCRLLETRARVTDNCKGQSARRGRVTKPRPLRKSAPYTAPGDTIPRCLVFERNRT